MHFTNLSNLTGKPLFGRWHRALDTGYRKPKRGHELAIASAIPPMALGKAPRCPDLRTHAELISYRSINLSPVGAATAEIQPWNARPPQPHRGEFGKSFHPFRCWRTIVSDFVCVGKQKAPVPCCRRAIVVDNIYADFPRVLRYGGAGVVHAGFRGVGKSVQGFLEWTGLVRCRS